MQSAKSGPWQIAVSPLLHGLIMLTKLQANQIAENLTTQASTSKRGTFGTTIDIPGPIPKNSLAAIGMLPLALMSLSHSERGDLALILAYCLICIAVVAQIKNRSYVKRTPLVRINESSLIFFGNTEKQQRVFQRAAISAIRLSRQPYFWRSSYRFSIVAG